MAFTSGFIAFFDQNYKLVDMKDKAFATKKGHPSEGWNQVCLGNLFKMANEVMTIRGSKTEFIRW